MTNQVCVIHEIDLSDNEHIVIGAVDSFDKIEPLMKKYYGSYELIGKEIVAEANIYSKYSITVTDPGFCFGDKYRIWVEVFELNEI